MAKAKFLTALFGGVSALSVAAVAHAQAPDGADATVEEVVITGSRVIQNGNNSPTPVTVVAVENLQMATPSTVPDALNRLPVFNGSGSQVSVPAASNTNGAANSLNLRSIGAARTLILFDGRRVPSNNIDNLPQMLMQRVDIVTGGASAVYGSDAVAGVVNFIIDKNFNGLKINAQRGVSDIGDGKNYRIGIAAGRDFLDGRLHLEGSIDHYNDPGIFNKLTRQVGRDVYTTQGAGTVANPYRLVKDTRINTTSFGGKILTGPLADQNFSANGVLSPFVHGAATGNNTIESGGDGGYFYNASLKSMLKNTQYFGRMDFELSENVNFFFQGTYVDGNNKNTHQTNEFRGITLSANNAFLAPQYRAAYAAAGVTTFNFGKMMRQAPPLQPETFYDSMIFTGGFEGRLGDYNWEISAMHSVANQHTRNNANVRNDRAAAALDAVVDPSTGNIVCNVTLTHPGLYPGCVPLNLFGPTSESPEAINYILEVTSFDTETRLDSLSGSFAGSPFSTWAGPVEMAISGEYRHLQSDTVSNAQPTDRADCTGLRFNCNANTARWISNVVADARDRSQKVSEAAIEADVPLVKDAPFIQSFNLNGAARYTYYDTSGKVWTWKLGANWAVNDELNIRATRSRDIRAPNLNELFGPISINPAGITDLHTGISGQAPVQSAGNPNLAPEVANTLTAGVVYRPNWLRGFSAAVDFYEIKIDNGIGNVSGNNATVARLCEESNGTSTLCSLYVRPLPFSDRSPANYPSLILSQGLNIASFYSRGVDAEVNYATDLAGGRLSLRGLMTYQPRQVSVTIPGSPELNAAGAAGLPSVRVTAFANYTRGPFGLNVQQRWHNSTRRSSDPAQVWAVGRVPSFYTTDLTATYNLAMFGGNNQFFVTAQNLFDKKPPAHGGTGGAASVPGLFLATTNGDDFIGRYFTFGFRFRH